MLIFTPKYFFHTFGSETGVKSPSRYAFGRASTYGAETWHGVGFGELGEPSTFCHDLTGQRSSRGQIVQECPMATKFDE